MDRYQRVERPRPETTAISENEIRITTQGLIRNYIIYATSLLQEKQVEEIILKAMGQAISKTVAIVEILKKNISGLHQDTSISSVSITDVWEPIEEGLVPLEMTRHVSMISISLSMKELYKNSPGYQAPIYVEWPRPQRQYYQQRQQQQHQTRLAPPVEETYGQGRGRGRGRGWGGRWGYGGGYRGGYDGGYDGGYGSGYGGAYGSSYGGGYDGGYGNNQDNGGRNYNWNGHGGRGRTGGYRGGGYERGRGARGGRGYGLGQGRTGPRGRGNHSDKRGNY